jgi:hypothetical protein
MDPILLNTKAVDLMRQGKLKEATSDLRAALGELLRRVGQREDVDLADKVTPNYLSIRSVPLEESLSLVENSSNQDHHAFSLFDRALVIENADLAAVSIADQSCATAVVMYNMGLALQLQGMQDLRSKQANFKKATRLYQMATNVLEGRTGSEDHVSSGLVYLAVSNNMGYIYSHFCNTSEAQRCLTWLFTILQAMGISNTDILGDEYLPFHLNIVVLHGQHALAAAAA